MSNFEPIPPEESQQSMPAIRPFRFSLKTLLLSTTLLAFMLATVLVMPTSLSRILTGAIWIAGSSWLVVGLIYGRTEQRAFCIGAAIVVSSAWTGIGGRYMQGIHMLYEGNPTFKLPPAFNPWIDILVFAGTAVLNGIFCVYARRYFERNAR